MNNTEIRKALRELLYKGYELDYKYPRDHEKIFAAIEALFPITNESLKDDDLGWETCKKSVGQRAIDYAIENYSGTPTSNYVMSVAAYSYHRGMNVNGIIKEPETAKSEQTKERSDTELWEQATNCAIICNYFATHHDSRDRNEYLKSKFHITRK